MKTFGKSQKNAHKRLTINKLSTIFIIGIYNLILEVHNENCIK